MAVLVLIKILSSAKKEEEKRENEKKIFQWWPKKKVFRIRCLAIRCNPHHNLLPSCVARTFKAKITFSLEIFLQFSMKIKLLRRHFSVFFETFFMLAWGSKKTRKWEKFSLSLSGGEAKQQQCLVVWVEKKGQWKEEKSWWWWWWRE